MLHGKQLEKSKLVHVGIVKLIKEQTKRRQENTRGRKKGNRSARPRGKRDGDVDEAGTSTCNPCFVSLERSRVSKRR